MTRTTWIAALLCLAAGSAAAGNEVYRCGSTYQATPCAGGKAIDGDARSASEVAAGRDVAARDRQLADALTHDRLQAEANARPAVAVSIGPRPAADAAAKPRKAKSKAKKAAKEGVFVAEVPGSGKKKKAKPA